MGKLWISRYLSVLVPCDEIEKEKETGSVGRTKVKEVKICDDTNYGGENDTKLTI